MVLNLVVICYCDIDEYTLVFSFPADIETREMVPSYTSTREYY